MKYLLQKKGAIQNVPICTSNRFFPRKKKEYLPPRYDKFDCFPSTTTFYLASVEKKKNVDFNFFK